MDTSTSLEASPPSSPSSSSSTTSSSSPYNVFLSFGEDTRKTFTDHLYWTMKDAGIDFFMEENESIRRGENISDKVKQIIERSKVSVIVFSSMYADSIWCLEELVQIMECRRTLKQMVLPIFYDLSPSDVLGSFLLAFQKHVERFHEDTDIQEKLRRWTDALTVSAGLAVWTDALTAVAGLTVWTDALTAAAGLPARVFRTTNGYEGMFIRVIIDEIAKLLQSPTPIEIAFTDSVKSPLSTPPGFMGCKSGEIELGLSNVSQVRTSHNLTYASALKSYNTSALAPRTQMGANLRLQNMHKRSISFLRSLNRMRLREGIQATRPTSSQMHHMISERKRSEKLNESFHKLKSLLPPGTKKDKASVLTTAREYLTGLKAQVAELTKRNQQLEARLLPLASLGANEAAAAAGSSNERVSLTVTSVSTESSPDQDEQIIDLKVILRSQESCTEDMVIRILEFLKRVENVSLMSMEANTWISESNSNINRVILRLRVDQGTEWNEAAFQEAVRRVVADLVRRID